MNFTDNGNGTGTLAGTPAGGTGGTYSVTVTAANGVSPAATSVFTLTVDQAPAVTSGNSTTFVVNTAETFDVTTTGFPAGAITETGGALPAGVSLHDNGNNTAFIEGTPTADGLFTVTLSDSNGVGSAATQVFSLTVDQAPAITPSGSTTFTTGSAGTISFSTTGYPAISFTETGALPSGVNFTDNGNGTATLAGTPAGGTGGTYSVTVTAANGVSPAATDVFTLTVDQAPAVTSANSSTFTVGSASTFAVTTSGFPTHVTLSETGSLPSGVSFIDNGNGTASLAGTPVATTGETYVFTITGANGVGSNATQTFTLTVDEAPSVSSGTSTTFTTGSVGNFTITTIGFPLPSISKTGTLPSGLSFTDNGDGTATLAGTPARRPAGRIT